MNITFNKMQGLGNDFVVLDATTQPITLTSDGIRRLADRRYGVGCDQVLVLEPATAASHDFTYRIYNADGTEAEQCGNGARCMGLYIWHKQLSAKPTISLNTLKGVIEITREGSQAIAVNMGVPKLINAARQQGIVDGHNLDFRLVDVGNPHAVVFNYSGDEQQVVSIAQQLEQQVAAEGINVGFVKIDDPQHITLTVHERGVGLTPACGSGACAAMVASRAESLVDDRATVIQSGGPVEVRWQGPGQPVYLIGPAAFVFEGVWHGGEEQAQ